MSKKKAFPWVAVVSFVAVAAVVATAIPWGSLLPQSSAPTAPAAATLAPTVEPTAADVCAPEFIEQETLDFNTLAREFDDHSVIAQNTPREQLAPHITELQRIRRSSEAFTTSECLQTLKGLQLAYMNAFIDTLLALYATLTNPDQALTENDVAVVNQGMSLALEYQQQYLLELQDLLGIDPQLPTQQPTEDPAATPES